MDKFPTEVIPFKQVQRSWASFLTKITDPELKQLYHLNMNNMQEKLQWIQTRQNALSEARKQKREKTKLSKIANKSSATKPGHADNLKKEQVICDNNDDFDKTMQKNKYIDWMNNNDFTKDNSPNSFLKCLCQQNVKISEIINKAQGGLNILHQICKNPELENASVTIKCLIKLGFDIHCKTEKTEDTPLHIALFHGNKSVMLSLLNIGSGSNELFIKNKYKQTPLHSLMIGYNTKYHQNYIEMVSILFTKYNAEQIILERDIQGKTPLHIACLNQLCPIEIISILLKNGAYSYQTDKDGFYPKDYVNDWDDIERRNDIQIVMKWLKEGINKNLNIKKYVESTKNTQQNHGQYTPQTVTKSNDDKPNNKEKTEEAEKVEIRQIYGDDNDDDDDDNDDEEKKELITPIDTDNNQIISNPKSQKLEILNSHKIDSGDNDEDDDDDNNNNNNNIIIQNININNNDNNSDLDNVATETAIRFDQYIANNPDSADRIKKRRQRRKKERERRKKERERKRRQRTQQNPINWQTLIFDRTEYHLSEENECHENGYQIKMINGDMVTQKVFSSTMDPNKFVAK